MAGRESESDVMEGLVPGEDDCKGVRVVVVWLSKLVRLMLVGNARWRWSLWWKRGGVRWSSMPMVMDLVGCGSRYAGGCG